MDLTTGVAILGAVKTVFDLGEKVYRYGTTLLKKIRISVPKRKKVSRVYFRYLLKQLGTEKLRHPIIL